MKNYTTLQVAEILQLEPETIREYIRTGKMKAWKAGKEWRVTEDQLKEYMNERINVKEVI